MVEKIDFVITWVDGNDLKWKNAKNKFDVATSDDANITRFRDWDNLQYWFRGVEKYAPWVNKIHFVTYGHVPKWLNTQHSKLNIVKHEDYFPEKNILPVFSSHSIEINLHRIKNLEEKFVYFNDDTFIIDNVNEKDFFFNGLPCDEAILTPIYPDQEKNIFKHILLNNVKIINRNFQSKNCINKNLSKWFNIKYRKNILRNFLFYNWPGFIGFVNFHLPNAFLKSTFIKVWKQEPDVLISTTKRKFRNIEDVNQYLFKYWQFAEGKIYPKSISDFGKYFDVTSNNIALIDTILKQKYKMICINDTDNNFNFEQQKSLINQSLQKILPNKSKFEI